MEERRRECGREKMSKEEGSEGGREEGRERVAEGSGALRQ